MHALTLLLSTLPLALLASADPQPRPEGPLRIQAVRGGKPSAEMAAMLAEAAESQGRLVYPDAEAKGVPDSEAKADKITHPEPEAKVTERDPANWEDYPECSVSLPISHFLVQSRSVKVGRAVGATGC